MVVFLLRHMLKTEKEKARRTIDALNREMFATGQEKPEESGCFAERFGG